MNLVRRVYDGLVAALRELGPHAAIALLLPGGTLIVASLWILQHRPWFFAHVRRGLAVVLARIFPLPTRTDVSAVRVRGG
jgi:hypothetical protein